MLRTFLHYSVSKLPGNVGNARSVPLPADAWWLLFDNTIIEEIVDHKYLYRKDCG